MHPFCPGRIKLYVIAREWFVCGGMLLAAGKIGRKYNGIRRCRFLETIKIDEKSYA